MGKEKKPMYMEIYDHMLGEIEDQKYQQGDILPSEKELAEMYNVSVITSKKVLNMLAGEGYVKRIPGRGTFVDFSQEKAETKKKLIGFVTNEINMDYGLSMFRTVEELAEEKGIFIVPRFSYDNRDGEEKALQSLLDLNVDGIIDATTHGEDISPALLKILLNNVPIVLTDRFLKGIRAPYVGTDNLKATANATNYLFELGHRCISFVTRPYHNSNVLENRVSGFIRSHAEHGSPINESIWITDMDNDLSGYPDEESKRKEIEKVKKLLIHNENITCFFSAEANFSLIIEKAVEELGLKVPEDISIITFDSYNDFLDRCFMTHIQQREKQIASKAMDLILDEINNHTGNTEQKILIDADIIKGCSTAPCRKS